MKSLMLLFACVLVLAGSNKATGQPISERPLVKSNIALLDAWIDSQMAYGDIPGMALAIIHDQETVFSKAYGYADREANRPLTPDTRFRLASHSKLFTALAIMKLRDAGKLNLDDPVARHLSWFRPENPVATPVTIWQLLTHTSGLHREGSDSPFWTDWNFPSLDENRHLH